MSRQARRRVLPSEHQRRLSRRRQVCTRALGWYSGSAATVDRRPQTITLMICNYSAKEDLEYFACARDWGVLHNHNSRDYNTLHLVSINSMSRCDNAGENGVTRLAKVRCPTGLGFDIDRQTCDWKKNVKNCKELSSKFRVPTGESQPPNNPLSPYKLCYFAFVSLFISTRTYLPNLYIYISC